MGRLRPETLATLRGGLARAATDLDVSLTGGVEGVSSPLPRSDPQGDARAQPVQGAVTVADEVPGDQFRRVSSSARTVSRGVLWKLGSQTTIQIVGFGVSVAVARLLEPSQY